MQTMLQIKARWIVEQLIDRLSQKNKDDVHLTLNASNVLSEFAENETFF